MPRAATSPTEALTDEQRELVESSEWVVGWFMERFSKHYIALGHRPEDLRQFCWLHICEAAQRFDSKRLWSTYVCGCVAKQLITDTSKRGQLLKPRIHKGQFDYRKVELRPHSSTRSKSACISALDAVPSPEQPVDHRDEIANALSSLSPCERDIVESHYGLNGKIPTSNREIAHNYGIHTSAVTAILQYAILKLKEALKVVQE